jgi:hypothetical protein
MVQWGHEMSEVVKARADSIIHLILCRDFIHLLYYKDSNVPNNGFSIIFYCKWEKLQAEPVINP